jgi:hypothetical protein
MRAPVLALAALLLALSASLASGAGARTQIRIAFRPDGSATVPRVVWTLRCDPPGGTHPTPAVACRRLLAAGRQAFLPIPPDTACTEIYGGPQTAVVSGTVAGAGVWTKLRRDNGCEIARWDALRFLLPAPR